MAVSPATSFIHLRPLFIDVRHFLWCSISFERRHGVPFEDTAFGENWDRYSAELPQSAGFVKVLALTG